MCRNLGKRWSGVVVLMAAVSFCAVFIKCDSAQKAGKMIEELFESKEVKMVKKGNLSGCPGHTINELVENYLNNPKWESGKANDGKTYVNVGGGFKFRDKSVHGILQFLIKDDSFSFYAFEIDDRPQSDFLAMILLRNMCNAVENGETEGYDDEED